MDPDPARPHSAWQAGQSGSLISRATASLSAPTSQTNPMSSMSGYHDIATRPTPSRWWFASSAFPMIAGTLGPVASAFSILALVRPWRQHRAPGTAIDTAPFIPDPAWLVAINAVQLGVALASNLFLLLNMARRVRFAIAQPLTIIGWFVSAGCLLGLTATARPGGPLERSAGVPVHQIMWSQAFYYGVIAAVLYFVVAGLMCVTVYGAASAHYAPDFNLSTSQRTLMLQTILFLFYLLLGALMFSELEGWAYLDGVYWAMVTLFTIGFGDFVLHKRTSRGLLVPFALVGIISLGLVIGSIRSLVLERGQLRIDRRIVEKKRQNMVDALDRSGHIDMLTPGAGSSEIQRRRAEFHLMRAVQAQAAARHRWLAMGTSFALWLVLWLVGAKVFAETEKHVQSWTYFDGFYFTFVSLTTLGYGDRVPQSNAGKAIFVFWCLLALPTMTIMISNAGDTVARVVRDVTIALGNVTILPGERSFSAEVKWLVSQLTCGALWSEFYTRDRLTRNGDAEAVLLREISGEGRVHLRSREAVARAIVRAAEADELEMPAAPRGWELHCVLSAEIAAVARDVCDEKARGKAYSYEEWTWFLRLLGEEEGNQQGHGVAGRKAEEEGWSWMGVRSPLMSEQDEAQWILERLIERLRRELYALEEKS
ncbi:hypothetical protein TD95_002709 [Thielaviopsis punctulata]|uniref:Potassium channel domain-containing protein n=1 Tax=Thielaviopsis punctulata TaxID=72032 RepID=A0A0F4Z613_9PEZI|nr:hypothetical protein TD95_002709 [Thielaviopsis punctulata]